MVKPATVQNSSLYEIHGGLSSLKLESLSVLITQQTIFLYKQVHSPRSWVVKQWCLKALHSIAPKEQFIRAARPSNMLSSNWQKRSVSSINVPELLREVISPTMAALLCAAPTMTIAVVLPYMLIWLLNYETPPPTPVFV